MSKLAIHRDLRYQGLTLIEVIIGLLLIASCIIGIAAIYAQHEHSLRGGTSHHVAARLSDEMASLIQRQPDTSTNYETGLGHTCDATQDINNTANEVACWQDKVARELSNGTALITLDSNSIPENYVITISWTDQYIGTASYVRRVPVNSGKSK